MMVTCVQSPHTVEGGVLNYGGQQKKFGFFVDFSFFDLQILTLQTPTEYCGKKPKKSIIAVHHCLMGGEN